MSARAERAVKDLDVAIRQLEEAKKHLPEVLRRNEETAQHDGLNRNGGAGKGPDVADPTGNAATALPVPDIVDEWTSGLVDELDVVSAATNRVAGFMRLLMADALAQQHRANSIPNCADCGKPVFERLKAGRCDACRMHRTRHGHEFRWVAGAEAEERRRCVRCASDDQQEVA